jgi:hypothetical protein
VPRRLLAIVAALGMIVGAYVYRYGVPGGGGGDDGPDGDGGAAAGAVVCASELGPVCDAIPGATVESAGTTADRLLSVRNVGEAGVRAWLTPGPWPAMVDEGRSLRSLSPLFEEQTVLASTPLVALVKKGKAPAGCGTAVTWACLGQAAQDPVNRIGIEDATRSTGLFVRAGVLVGAFGNADFGSNDFPDAQSTLDAFATRNRDAIARGATDLQRFLVSAPDVPLYLTTRAASVTNPTVDLAVPSPTLNVQAILATTGGDGGVDRDRIVEGLEAAGWVPGRGGAAGLPSPGVLLALREAL